MDFLSARLIEAREVLVLNNAHRMRGGRMVKEFHNVRVIPFKLTLAVSDFIKSDLEIWQSRLNTMGKCQLNLLSAPPARV